MKIKKFDEKIASLGEDNRKAVSRICDLDGQIKAIKNESTPEECKRLWELSSKLSSFTKELEKTYEKWIFRSNGDDDVIPGDFPDLEEFLFPVAQELRTIYDKMIKHATFLRNEAALKLYGDKIQALEKESADLKAIIGSNAAAIQTAKENRLYHSEDLPFDPEDLVEMAKLIGVIPEEFIPVPEEDGVCYVVEFDLTAKDGEDFYDQATDEGKRLVRLLEERFDDVADFDYDCDIVDEDEETETAVAKVSMFIYRKEV